MKRTIILSLILLTLVMSLSGCFKGNTYTPENISAAVTFKAKDYQCKGDFLFLKDGERKLTLSEPDSIKGCFARDKEGALILTYDNVSAVINENSPIKKLFVIVEDFTSKTHKMPSGGIEIIEGITSYGRYEIEFDWGKGRIMKIVTEDTEYIFE